MLVDERSRRAVEVAEQFSDGLTSDSQREDALRAAGDAEQVAEAWLGENRDNCYSPTSGVYHAAHAARLTLEKECRVWLDDVARSIFDVAACDPGGSEEEEIEAHGHLLRDLFNPFPPAVKPSWLSWNHGTILHFAQSIYDCHSFKDMPILADALEEAGCTSKDLVKHCRQPGGHIRGCWVLDLLLDKGESPVSLAGQSSPEP
jgi:hypothetical protein